MASRPLIQKSYDGTFEVMLPDIRGNTAHILPYCFHRMQDAADWIVSRKGRLLIKQARKHAREMQRLTGVAIASAE